MPEKSSPPDLRVQSGFMVNLVEEANGPTAPFVRYAQPDQLETELDWAAGHNVHLVDFLLSDPGQINADQLNTMLEERNLGCGAIGSGGIAAAHKLFFTHPNADNRRAAIKACGNLMRLGAKIGDGVPVIIGSMQGQRYSTSTRLTPATAKWSEARWPEIDQAHIWLKEALIELGQLADKLNVRLVYEALNYGESNLGDLTTLDALVKSTGQKSIGFLIDSYHFLCEGWDKGLIINLKTPVIYSHVVGLDRWYAGHENDSARLNEFVRAMYRYCGPMIAECGPWPNSDTAMQKTMEWLMANFKN